MSEKGRKNWLTFQPSKCGFSVSHSGAHIVASNGCAFLFATPKSVAFTGILLKALL